MRHRLGNAGPDAGPEFELDVLTLPPGGLLAEPAGPGWLLVCRGRIEAAWAGGKAVVRAAEYCRLPAAGALRLTGRDDSRFWLCAADADAWEWLAGRGLAAGALAPFLLARPSGRAAAQVLPVPREELGRLEGGLRALQAESAAGGEGAGDLVALRLLEVLIRLARLAPEPGPGHSLVWTIDEVARHLERHHAGRFTLEELVARCAMNTSDFCRQFKAATGYPVFEFLNRQRIARACVLLKRTDQTILEISETVGYHNVSFFNRCFARIMGTTPREFRASR